MAPHRESFDRIRDVVRDISQLDYGAKDLRKYLGAEMGGLNVKQNEAIIALSSMVRNIVLALAALNNELSHLSIDDRTFQISIGESKLSLDRNGEIAASVGDASIRMKRDGSIDIVGGNNLRIRAAGAITIHGTSDVTVMSSKELHLKGVQQT